MSLIHQGMRIKPVPDGAIMGTNKANAVIKVCNAFLNLLVRRGGAADSLVISDYNAILQLAESGNSTSGGSPAYLFQSMEDDYLVCVTYDGTTVGTDDIKIAKPTKLRFSIEDETVDGDDITYSAWDTSAQTRSATDGTNTETQVIVPRYLVGDVIYAVPVATFVTDPDADPAVDIALMDSNVDARAWMAVP